MKIVNRYISSEVLTTFAGVLLVLLMILFGGLFAKMLGQVAAGKLAASVLLPMVFVVAVKSLPTLLTVALYLGILIAIGRLYKDQEMSALRAAGFGYRQLAVPVGGIALIFVVLTSLLSFYIQPIAQKMQDDIVSEAAQSVDVAGITPGKFIVIPSSQMVVFAEAISGDALERVFVFSEAEDRLHIIAARAAEQVDTESLGSVLLELQDGSAYEQLHDTADATSLIEFRQQGIQLPRANIKYRERLSSTSTRDLMAANDLESRAELQWRWAYPIAIFLLAMLALPMSFTTPRQGQFTKLALAIGVYIIYQNLLGLAQNWMVKATTPAWMGIWWVHLLVVVLFFALLLKQYSFAYLSGRPGRNQQAEVAG